MSVKEELNKPELIPSKWNRNTVADGTWLQKHTLDRLKERDDFLADAIDNLSGNTDDNLSALSAAIDYVSGSYSSFYTNEYLQFKEDVESSAAQFDTDLQNEINNRIEKDDYHDEAIETIKQQIDTMNAATDVVDVWGTYSAFSAEWRDTYFPGGSALITNNDIIKIINDEYTEIEDNLTTGHQTYFRWVCNDPVPSGPDDGQWEYVGYTDPYYNRTEVDDKILGIENTIIDLSGTVADNYLSAKGAVHQGKNIVVTEDSTKPEITISTNEDVEFTNVSSTNISATNVTASTAQGNSANFTTGNFTNLTSTNVTATNIQGTQANYTNFSGSYLTGVNGNNTVTATISGLINSASEGGAMTGIHNISELEFRYQEGSTPTEIITDLATSADKLIFLPSNGCENWLTFSKESYSPEHHEQVININAPNFVRLIDAKLATSDFTDWSGSTASLFSGTSRSAKSANSATNAYSATTAYAAQNVGNVGSADLIGSAESGNLAWKALTGAKWKADTTTMGDVSAGFTLSAGSGVGFNKNYTNHILTISAEGKTYADGDYIRITGTTNKINVTGTLINSAQSGQSAYNWITTKSATLQAGQGIGFYSAGPNILGISAEGTKVSAGGNIQHPTEYTTNVNLSAAGGVQFVTADNDVLGIKTSTMEYSPYNSTYSDITSLKISAVGLQGTKYESVVKVNDNVYGILLPDPSPSEHLKIPVARHDGTRGYYYLDTVTAAIGNYVSAANSQQITIATATTLPTPASMENGVYYIV